MDGYDGSGNLLDFKKRQIWRERRLADVGISPVTVDFLVRYNSRCNRDCLFGIVESGVDLAWLDQVGLNGCFGVWDDGYVWTEDGTGSVLLSLFS